MFQSDDDVRADQTREIKQIFNAHSVKFVVRLATPESLCFGCVDGHGWRTSVMGGGASVCV